MSRGVGCNQAQLGRQNIRHYDQDLLAGYQPDEMVVEKRCGSFSRVKFLFILRYTNSFQDGDEAANSKLVHNFKRLVDVTEIPGTISTTIWSCDTSPPPSRKDGSVERFSELTWTVAIKWELLPRFINNRDEEFYELRYQAELKRSGGSTDIGLLYAQFSYALSMQS